MNPDSRLGRLLLERRLVLVCGAGGTGKTTISASLGLLASSLGRKTVICTIDPARRLGHSLGLVHLGGDPVLVDTSSLGPGGAPLHAMQLDAKATLDRMVLELASAERARRILENPFYRQISSVLSGTQEYAAMEELFELNSEGKYDLIVVDTPPTRSALDFLDAPRRLLDFLEGRLLRYLLWPYLAAGRTYLKVFSLGATAFLKAAKTITGSAVLEDVANFLAAFEGMYGSFKRRAREVYSLLRSPEAAFLVVASPGEFALNEASHFARRLLEEGMPLEAVVVNRVAEPPTRTRPPEGLAEGAPPELVSLHRLALFLWEAREAQAALVARYLEWVKGSGIPLVFLPDLGVEVVELPALHQLAVHLMEAGG